MMWFVVAIVGPIVLTALILVVVFGAIRRAIAAEAAGLTDVVLDSGLTKMTTRFGNFRSARLIRGGLRRNPVQAVLTKTHLHLLERPQRYGIFERADLIRFTVGTLDGKLHLLSNEPPNASGTIDYRIDLADPERWVSALIEAGAKPA